MCVIQYNQHHTNTTKQNGCKDQNLDDLKPCQKHDIVLEHSTK